jgi:hypothetical protein
MKSLRFLQALALLPACAGAPAPGPSPGTAPSTATSTTAPAPAGSDPTVGVGPCRCSWDTNAGAAPRVCKKGEVAHDGNACTPGHHAPKVYPMEGPLPPPDLIA